MNTLFRQRHRPKRFLSIVIGLFLVLGWSTPLTTAAKPRPQESPEHFEYIVQPGDTLLLIALRYNLNPGEIALVNHLSNPNLIIPGQPLILPGFQPPIHIPAGLSTPNYTTHLVQPGETISGIAIFHGVSVNYLIAMNQVIDPDFLQIGQILKVPQGLPPAPNPLTSPFDTIKLSEPTIIQGHTLVVEITLSEAASLSGTFEARPIIFHAAGNNRYWGLVPIHALQGPNVYPILISATLPDGRAVATFKNVTVTEGPYGLENIQLDEERGQLLDADLIQNESEKLRNIWSQVTLRPRWEGPFRYPVAVDTLRITSNYGTRRTYNGSQELSFHGGTDFGGGAGAPIFAPAAGTVALAEPLTVRGNAVVIDHGLGLYSNYWHQSQIVVSVGQIVQPGDLIGYIGSTGLATGPHLHWELRLHGIAVDPLQWVQQSIP